METIIRYIEAQVNGAGEKKRPNMWYSPRKQAETGATAAIGRARSLPDEMKLAMPFPRID
jgi:hypothetical protein